MGDLIKRKTGEEGEIFNKWLESRLIRRNKNVLSAELGATGSGKSYRDLRKAELWYKYHFKEKFPVENICFGLNQIMARLNDEKIRKGEVFIIEEAGVNLGSRDWQKNVSKMFNYVLQSFRSMNIGLFFNLPYLSMLDSQARHLLHYYAESVGIDYDKGVNKCKPFFLQVAQGTGKIYRHYPAVKINRRVTKVKRFNYIMPSQYLIDAYEEKKDKYLKGIIKEFSDKMNGKEKEKKPNERFLRWYHEWKYGGKTHQQIADEEGYSRVHITMSIKEARKYLNIDENKGKEGNEGISSVSNQSQTPSNLILR